MMVGNSVSEELHILFKIFRRGVPLSPGSRLTRRLTAAYGKRAAVHQNCRPGERRKRAVNARRIQLVFGVSGTVIVGTL